MDRNQRRASGFAGVTVGLIFVFLVQGAAWGSAPEAAPRSNATARGPLFLTPIVPFEFNPAFAEFSDVDGDGDLDLLVVESEGNTPSVLLNNGRGAFGEKRPYALTSVGAPFAVVGDLEPDGDPDVIAGGSCSISPIPKPRH